MKHFILGCIMALFLQATAVSAPKEAPPGYTMSQIPVMCASNDQVMMDLDSKGYELLNLSLGRKNANPEEEPVFMVSYYVHPEAGSTVAVMNIPQSTDACIIFITYDLTVTIPAN
jgi:hypothetical protein